ncbi:MAG: hypothetical protein ABIZ95_04780 [Pyrinomonadaceae bacterium]
MPINLIAPPGTGWRIEPTIVPAKIANSRHHYAVTPAGGPIPKIAPTTASTISHRASLPVHVWLDVNASLVSV